MLKDLLYVEPEQSSLRSWKARYVRRWGTTKKIGLAFAKIGARKASEVVKMQFCKEMSGVHGVNVERLVEMAFDKETNEAFFAASQRFDSGHWVPPVWEKEDWWKDSPYSRLHVAHEAKENAGQLAFAENLTKLKLDRYTTTKPGRYLTKFFSEVLNETEIKHWAERQAATAQPAEVLFIGNDDKEGWMRVYEEGPDSCMSGSSSECVHVYAHADSVLRLAYLQRGGRIVGRCIVRDDTKMYIRVYPGYSGAQETRDHTTLRTALEELGYTPGNLVGVKLEAKVANRWDARYVMPYLDRGTLSSCPSVRLSSDEKHFRVTEDDGPCADNTDGEISLHQHTCPECWNSVDDEDDLHYVECADHSVCEHCLNNNYVCAIGRRGHEYLIPSDDAVEVGGTYYDPDYLSDNGIHECQYTNDYYHTDDLCSTLAGSVNCDDAVALDVEDSEGNSYACPGDTTETHDGRTIHDDDVMTEEINGVEVVFHRDDDIDAYRAEHEEKEEA